MNAMLEALVRDRMRQQARDAEQLRFARQLRQSRGSVRRRNRDG